MHNIDIGSKIKALRIQNKMTLKQLSEKTNFSVGFLSQLERGMTSIAIDSLGEMARIFGVELSAFFEENKVEKGNDIVRSYEKKATAVSPSIIQFNLSRNLDAFGFLPREVHIMPFSTLGDDVALYHHEGEEFVYVLEGVLTIRTDDGEWELYPGDSIQIHSECNHNWQNKTNAVTKILCVNTPNPFKK